MFALLYGTGEEGQGENIAIGTFYYVLVAEVLTGGIDITRPATLHPDFLAD